MPELQMILLPFAGGNALSFNRLISCLSPEIRCDTVEYAGRGGRRREGFIRDYEAFLDDAAARIAAARDPSLPYVLFGYSLGSALAYDLLRTGRLDSEPRYLIICAREFVAHRHETQTYAALSRDEFVEKILAMGGVDPRLLRDPRFREIALAPLEADYEIWSQYRYRPLQKSFAWPLLVFYSQNDTPEEKVRGWSSVTCDGIEFYEMGENHFFIHEHYAEMARIINRTLLSESGG